MLKAWRRYSTIKQARHSKACIVLMLFFALIVYLNATACASSLPDSIAIIIYPVDSTYQKTIFAGTQKGSLLLSEFHFVNKNRLDSLLNALKNKDMVFDSLKRNHRKISTLQFSLIVNQDTAYFVTSLLPDMAYEKRQNTESSYRRILMISFLIALVIFTFIVLFLIQRELQARRELTKMEVKYETEHKPRLERLNFFYDELIGGLEDANNSLGEIRNFIFFLDEINQADRSRDNPAAAIKDYHEESQILKDAQQHLKTLFNICRKGLAAEDFGTIGKIEKYNTKYHFTFDRILDDHNVRIVHCGWKTPGPKEKIIKKAFVKSIDPE